MPLIIDRRALLVTAGLGFGGLMLPGGALAAEALAALRGFTHNVASGEPGQESMLLWTRFVPKSGGTAKVRVEVSADQRVFKNHHRRADGDRPVARSYREDHR